ncbi:MAG TPA: DMT family transporter [Chthoniobacterales bacterium]
MTPHTKGLLFLFLVTLAWGLSFCLVKALSLALGEGWGPAAGIISIRFLLAALPLIGLQLLKGRWRPTAAEWRQGGLIAFFCATGMLLQAHALSYTLASTSAFLTQGCAILVPLWVALTRRQLPPAKILLPLALVIAGVAILSGVDFRTFRMGRGEFETLLSCVFFTGLMLTIESPRYARTDKALVTVVFLLLGGLGALPLALANGGGESLAILLGQGSTLLVMAVLAFISTTLGFYWMVKWQPNVTATEAGIVYCLEPVWASLLSLFLPVILAGLMGVAYANEQITLAMVLGGGLILSASVLLALVTPPPKTAAPDLPKAGA